MEENARGTLRKERREQREKQHKYQHNYQNIPYQNQNFISISRKNIVPLWYIFCYRKMNDLCLSVYAVVRAHSKTEY